MLSVLRPLNMQFKMDYARMLQLSSNYDAGIGVSINSPSRTIHSFFLFTKILASVLAATGSFGLLITFYEELVQANPYDANYWIELIKLYEKTGQSKKSARAINKGRKTHRYFDALLAMHLQEQRQRPTLKIPSQTKYNGNINR